MNSFLNRRQNWYIFVRVLYLLTAQNIEKKLKSENLYEDVIVMRIEGFFKLSNSSNAPIRANKYFWNVCGTLKAPLSVFCQQIMCT